MSTGENNVFGGGRESRRWEQMERLFNALADLGITNADSTFVDGLEALPEPTDEERARFAEFGDIAPITDDEIMRLPDGTLHTAFVRDISADPANAYIDLTDSL